MYTQPRLPSRGTCARCGQPGATHRILDGPVFLMHQRCGLRHFEERSAGAPPLPDALASVTPDQPSPEGPNQDN